MTDQKYIAELLYKQLQGNLTESEKEHLEAWKDISEENAVLLAELHSDKFHEEVLTQYSTQQLISLRGNILSKITLKRKPQATILMFRKWGWVAAVLCLTFGATYLLQTRTSESLREITSSDEHQILPVNEGTILTLANGNQVNLDSIATTDEFNASQQMQVSDGVLTYAQQDPNVANFENNVYNKVQTGKGNKYQLLLPDGSKVWLNASSSIRFPTNFKNDRRVVEVTGEAYFEVAVFKSAKGSVPFYVDVQSDQGNALVEVLGTHFNVMAYHNEQNITVTLLEGKVKLSNDQNRSGKEINPGYQLQISDNGKSMAMSEANLEEAVAWKNGYFYFNKSDIKSIMRQLDRWYNFKVSFQGVPTKRFSGTIPRAASVSQILKMLELTGNVKFDISGDEITVKP